MIDKIIEGNEMQEQRARKIILGTSLAPFNIEKQRKAVKTWLDNGFQVISCNSKEEIEILRKVFSDAHIEFVEIKRNAEKSTGKKLPYIQDILEEASDRAEKVCGFINSDIILSDMPSGMYDYIEHEAKDSIIIVHRNEINQLEDIKNLDWRLHFDGIDLFFLDKTLVNGFFDDGFYVQSVWDLCILTKCKLLGITIKELVNPIAFHQRHAIQWDFEKSELLVTKFMEKYSYQQKNAYKRALDLYYTILYEDCQQICFCRNINACCLFVLDRKSDSTVESIYQQEYPNIEIEYSGSNDDKPDIVFYLKGELNFSKVFCKAVIYIFEQFGCTSLDFGRFFISDKNGRYCYNELNRNISTIQKINETCSVFIHAVRKNAISKKKHGILYYPLVYEKLNTFDGSISTLLQIKGDVYIMPAGIRAREWYRNNSDDINFKIAGYLDNNIKSNDEAKMQVKPVEIISKKKEDVVVIVASKYYYDEIEEQLGRMISKDRIYNAGFMLEVGADGICYFDLDKYYKRWNYAGGGYKNHEIISSWIGVCA